MFHELLMMPTDIQGEYVFSLSVPDIFLLKEEFMNNRDDLLESIRALLLQSALSAYDIAAALRKPYSTLMRECNPYDHKAKMGAETLLRIMQVTNNIAPLRIMARALGYDIISLDKNKENSPNEEWKQQDLGEAWKFFEECPEKREDDDTKNP